MGKFETGIVEQYLSELRDIHSRGVGTKETSYYTPLVTLLNEVGQTLKPRIHSIMHPASRGAGIPDIGLFGPKKANRDEAAEFLQGEIPEHGVVEVKSTSEEVGLTADSEQVSRYWDRYRQVLVTNYRDFLLVGEDTSGRPTRLEPFRLAESADAFWKEAVHPRSMAERHGERLVEYLKRVMLHSATLTDPKDVAWFLASYARDAKARIEGKHLSALASLRAALEQDLGLKFDDARGDHFFHSTLVQTLFYGIFSAWVIWARESAGPERQPEFDWRTTAYHLRLPVLRELFLIVSEPGSLREENLEEPLDWACAVLNRVDRGRFFTRFREDEAVLHFYEPFLQAFDPELRKELGVNYTPTEIVRYMVTRVDNVLRDELHVEDGLADPRVHVLDPCCGTGKYLVEVLRKIDERLGSRVRDGLTANDVKHAALTRIHGFEIMPAPYVVSHLQLGLLLQSLGAPLAADGSERCGVYLTNALNGWEPAQKPKSTFFKSLDNEREQSEKVKRDTPILVIIGNPPYNGFAGVAVEEERGLSEAYRTVKRVPKPQGQGLNDLYVRFFRMAERRIVEKTGEGIVCFITNYSWLDGLSFTGMRERFLDAFDAIWIDCLNGDKYKTGKLTPDGKPDPSVFSTETNREGIQVGTAISLLARRQLHEPTDQVSFRHLWGSTKRADLADEAQGGRPGRYENVKPQPKLGLSFMPTQMQFDYLTWPTLPTLLPVAFPGVKTSRDDFLVDIDRDRLMERLKLYFDRSISHDGLRKLYLGIMTSTARYDAEAVRDQLLRRGILSQKVVRYCYRPFDNRWLYWEPETKLLDEKRSDYFPHVFPDNVWLEARQRQPKEDFDRGYVTSVLADNFANGLSTFFPLQLGAPDRQASTLHQHNTSAVAERFLTDVGASAEALFYHCVAVMRAPAFGSENRGALRQDWPRIPLPDTKKLLLASAELGKQVAALLDTESDVRGVTSGSIRPELKATGAATRVGGGSLSPEKGDLAVTAGWGHAGKGGVTMPGKGKHTERNYAEEELAAIREGAEALGLKPDEALARLGKSTYDVYLNERAFWRNVPAGVWDYSIGGYQVIKKWLSYREQELLKRDLKPEEARFASEMVRRIAAILLLQPALDENYKAVKVHSYSWPKKAAGQ